MVDCFLFQVVSVMFAFVALACMLMLCKSVLFLDCMIMIWVIF